MHLNTNQICCKFHQYHPEGAQLEMSEEIPDKHTDEYHSPIEQEYNSPNTESPRFFFRFTLSKRSVPDCPVLAA